MFVKTELKIVLIIEQNGSDYRCEPLPTRQFERGWLIVLSVRACDFEPNIAIFGVPLALGCLLDQGLKSPFLERGYAKFHRFFISGPVYRDLLNIRFEPAPVVAQPKRQKLFDITGSKLYGGFQGIK